jgi:tetratricopeptide (TPR) repeat protein
MYVSTSGRTFTAPPPNWKVGSWDNRQGFYARSPESLAGDLIRDGVTGIGASVAEPYLDGSVRPDILFPAYLAGFNLAETFYLATPSLSWTTIVVGDPLCRATGESKLTAEQLDPPIDPDSLMPVEFTRRWVKGAQDAAADLGLLRRDALKMTLKGTVLLARDERQAARAAFEEATSLEPKLNGAHFAVASLYEQAGEYDKAADRYRAILANQSSDVVAMNNLAYYLAAKAGKADDALPMARRAYTLSQGNPTVADTYAWVLYLSGDLAQAARYVGEAVRGAPGSGEIRFHAAAIYFAGGQLDVAKRELAKALELNPALGEQADVKDLRQKLGL